MKINERNKQMLISACTFGAHTELQGSKFYALMRLMEKKGVNVDSTDGSFDGYKAIEIGDGLFFACKRIVYKNGWSTLRCTLFST